MLNFKGRLQDYILTIILILFLSYLRPPGIAIVIPAMAYLISKKVIKNNKVIGITFILLLILVFQVIVILTNQQNFDEFFFATKEQFSLIGGYNALPYPTDKRWMIIIFFEAVFYKSLYLFSMWRPYFSWIHNAVNLSFTILYIPAIYGLKVLFRDNRQAFYFLFLTIAGYSSLYVFTYVNYHCRYMSIILPFIILPVGSGLKQIHVLRTNRQQSK